LTTLYLASAKNNYNWCAKKGDLQRAFLMLFRCFQHLHKLTIAAGDVCFHLTSRSIKTSANRFNNVDQSPSRADYSARFGGMTRSESPSLHAIVEESPSGCDSASSGGGEQWFPSPEGTQHRDTC
jgi:hypothetical protein